MVIGKDVNIHDHCDSKSHECATHCDRKRCEHVRLILIGRDAFMYRIEYTVPFGEMCSCTTHCDRKICVHVRLIVIGRYVFMYDSL